MGVVSRRRVWLVGVGGIYGCGCKEVIDFLILLIPTHLVSVIFCNNIPTFCSFLNVFRYILCIKYFFTQYKHTYGQLRASHGSHMKAAYTVLYMKKYTQT